MLTSHGITLSRHGVLEAPHTRRASPLLAGLLAGVTPSSGNSITRQGISLVSYPDMSNRTDVTSLDDIPACRHAEGTISSSDESDVWRMASEDSRAQARAFPADCPHPTHFHCRIYTTSSAGYSEFPAYSQMHIAPLPVRGAANYLRTVIVTAAVYRGLDSRLRPKANLSS